MKVTLHKDFIFGKAEQWTMTSKDERVYQITVSLPKHARHLSDVPVLYVLDGDAYFTMFREMIQLQSRRSDKTGIKDMAIVGIGYGADRSFHSNRVYDFTPPSHSLSLPIKPDGSPWPDSGGADKFLAFIEEELKPELEACFSFNKHQQMIFGHSLGGLFTLYTLFRKPTAFQRYFACSPSIWWNEKMIVEHVTQLMFEREDVRQNIKLFMAAGTEEKPFLLNDAKEMRNLLTDAGMETLFVEGQGENHASIVPSIFSTGMRYLQAE